MIMIIKPTGQPNICINKGEIYSQIQLFTNVLRAICNTNDLINHMQSTPCTEVTENSMYFSVMNPFDTPQ